jgi:antitoxin component of MazEF toxin-antitoxin module
MPYPQRMNKRLIRVGNSYALVIDKPIRRILHLTDRSVLEVSTDGTRIVIEPTGRLLQDDEIAHARPLLLGERVRGPESTNAGVNRRSLDIDAAKIWQELERRFGITPWHIEQIHNVPVPRIVRFAGWVCSRDVASKASEEELATLQRLKICRDRLRDGVGWEKAIEDALTAHPLPAANANPAATA